MQAPEELQRIQQLRALALVVAGQNLSLRQTLLAHILKSTNFDLQSCQHAFPSIQWQRLIFDKLPLVLESADKLISIFEKDYPIALRTIADPPMAIFHRGLCLQSLDCSDCVAIVGARRADYAALELSHKLAYRLAEAGQIIVSGLALGIDGAAHRGALESKSAFSTIAVLGSGLEIIYPPAHKDIFKQIEAGRGLVLSQFENKTAPYPSNFLNRNRLVAALSRVVIVIQASLKSGSLVTARHAIDQGKDVLVFPGDIENPRYQGSNKLIQNGAHLVTSIDDILSFLGLDYKSIDRSGELILRGVPDLQKRILKILMQQGALQVDALIRLIGAGSIEIDLLKLELEGRIERLPGNFLKIKS